MGYSLTWIAVEPSAERALFDHFGFEELEVTAECADFKISCTRFSGWTLVQWDHEDYLVREGVLKAISAHGRVVACEVEEHVMFSSVEEWSNGERVWGVAHDAQENVLHIATEGSVPAAFAGIYARHLKEQEKAGGQDADVDHLFDVPTELAAEIVGYEFNTAEGWEFRELRSNKKPARSHRRAIGTVIAQKDERPGLFARLFGKSRA